MALHQPPSTNPLACHLIKSYCHHGGTDLAGPVLHRIVILETLKRTCVDALGCVMDSDTPLAATDTRPRLGRTSWDVLPSISCRFSL